MRRTLNNWKPETRSLLKALVKAGCTLVEGTNGEELFKFDGDMGKFIDDLTATDESHLYIRTPSEPNKLAWLFLVYGNSPGELVNDYSCRVELDAVTEAHYNKWEGRKQPTITERD